MKFSFMCDKTRTPDGTHTVMNEHVPLHTQTCVRVMKCQIADICVAHRGVWGCFGACLLNEFSTQQIKSRFCSEFSAI